MKRLRRALVPFVLLTASAEAVTRVIIDTDAGVDDLMAIAFLLARPDVEVEAITVASGLAHVPKGAENVLRLVELSGRGAIPVYPGRETPLEGSAAFPDEWRRTSDELPGVNLPQSSRRVESRAAADYLSGRLSGGRRTRILALGPLTNLAEAMARIPSAARAIEEIVIMGGAVRVPGNLGDGGFFKTDNKAAEWNIFVDPTAARRVFTAGAPLRLIPLDATNRVPVDLEFLDELKRRALRPLGAAVARILDSERDLVASKLYFAWDPLAAVALLDRRAVRWRRLHIQIEADGRTREVSGRPNCQAALDADAARFRSIFLSAF